MDKHGAFLLFGRNSPSYKNNAKLAAHVKKAFEILRVAKLEEEDGGAGIMDEIDGNCGSGISVDKMAGHT